MTGSQSLQRIVKQLGWLSSCLLVGFGCSTAPTVPPAAGPTGIWQLVGVNGVAIPAVIISARYEQQIVAEDIVLRANHTYAMFTVERFFTGNVPPAAVADTVYNGGYWDTTNGDLIIGAVDATQSGDTLRIRSSDRGLSVYARQ
jgi:hypothetical protein